jgi:hypothetical protein
MSSALRTFSQVEPTIKFLRHLPSADPSDNTMYVADADMDIFVAANTATGNGLNTIVVSAAGAPTRLYSETLGALVRDLGRRVTIVSSAVTGSAHRQVWIQVQRVNGSVSEGVEDDTGAPYTYNTFWIRTFVDADDGDAIEWARLG